MKASEILSGWWNIVREDNIGHAMIELDGMYYISHVNARSYKFESSLPCDAPSGNGRWRANWTESGLRYVASGRSRAAANAQWRKYIVPLTEEAEMLRAIGC